MPYLLADVDVREPLPTLTLDARHSGVGVVVRRGGSPVGFVLEPLAPSTVLDPAALDTMIGSACAGRLVQEAVLEQLGGRGPLSQQSLTVAICTRARTDSLRACLASLLAVLADADGDATVEVLVVDNAPPDDATRALVAGLPDVRYVCEPTPGLDFARNRAVAEATGTLLAFLDDDVEVDRGWLRGLQLAWGEHPDAGCVTGLVLPFELATDAQVTFERYGGFRRGFQPLRFAGPRLAGNPLYPYGAGIFGAGCNMSYRRSVLVELGGFDEALDTGRPLPGGGDLDMFLRVVRAGYPLVYEPSYAVFHKHRREHAVLRRQLWTWGTGFLAYVDKTFRTDPAARPTLALLLAWWFAYQARENVRSLRGHSPLSPDLALAQLAGGVAGLFGMYARSRRRSERLRQRVATASATATPLAPA